MYTFIFISASIIYFVIFFFLVLESGLLFFFFYFDNKPHIKYKLNKFKKKKEGKQTEILELKETNHSEMDPHQLEMEKFKHQLWKFAMQTVQKLDSQDEKEKIPERTTEQKNSAEELQQKLFERGNPLTRRDTYEGRLYSALWWVIARLKTCLAGRDLEKKK